MPGRAEPHDSAPQDLVDDGHHRWLRMRMGAGLLVYEPMREDESFDGVVHVLVHPHGRRLRIVPPTVDA
jgi:hypothetical protein